MKTKKNVGVLLENGIHFNTVMSLSNKQVGVLAERFFKSKPMGDVEQAKKDSLQGMRAFIDNNMSLADPANKLSDNQVLDLIKGAARWAKSPNGSKFNKMAAEIYRIAKPLFEGNKKETNEVETYSTQTSVFNPASTTDKGEFDKVANNPNVNKEFSVTKNNQIAVTTGNVPNLAESGEVAEKFESKAQQGFFWAKCNTSKGVKKKKWCELAKEFSDETTKSDYKKMPEKKHSKQTDENYEKFLEERIMEMIERHIEPTMTKRDFIRSIQEKKNNSENFMLENPKKNSMFAQNKGMEMKTMKRPIGKISSFEMKENTKEKEAPTTPGIKTPTRRKNPHRDPAPGVKENPKANGGQKEAPSKPGIKTPTRRKNPHKDPAPGVKENPKAEEQKNDFMSTITSILNNA